MTVRLRDRLYADSPWISTNFVRVRIELKLIWNDKRSYESQRSKFQVNLISYAQDMIEARLDEDQPRVRIHRLATVRLDLIRIHQEASIRLNLIRIHQEASVRLDLIRIHQEASIRLDRFRVHHQNSTSYRSTSYPSKDNTLCIDQPVSTSHPSTNHCSYPSSWSAFIDTNKATSIDSNWATSVNTNWTASIDANKARLSIWTT